MTRTDKDCRSELLVGAAWGDLGEEARRELDAHLEECASCREELEALRWTLETVRKATPSIPETVREEDWQRLEVELDRIDGTRRLRRWSLRLAAGLALVIFGYWIGSRPEEHRFVANEVVSTAGRTDELASYLDRAEPLLMILANQPGAGLEMSSQRDRARELAAEAARLRASLIEAGQDRGISLVAELELIFLQWANLGDNESGAGTEILQGALDRRAVLFKLSLERLREEPPAAEV